MNAVKHTPTTSDQLRLIQQEALRLMEQAREVVRNTDQARKANRWLSHLVAVLTNDRGELDDSMPTVPNTIEALAKHCPSCGEAGCESVVDQVGMCHKGRHPGL